MLILDRASCFRCSHWFLVVSERSYQVQSEAIRFSRVASMPSMPSKARKLSGAAPTTPFLSSCRAVKIDL